MNTTTRKAETDPLVRGATAVDFYRRIGARVAAHLPVEVTLAGSPGGIRARTRDIGVDGVCIQTQSMLPLGNVSKLRIAFPGKEVTALVEACWESELGRGEGPLTGLRFLKMPDADRMFTWAFVQERGRDIASFIRRSPDFEDLDFDDSFDLALYTRLREVERFGLLYAQGAASASAASVFIVQSGSIALEAELGGRERLRLAALDTGRVFGGQPTISGRPSSEAAVALEPSLMLEFDQFSIAYLERAKPLLSRALRQAVASSSAGRFDDLLARYAALRNKEFTRSKERA